MLKTSYVEAPYKKMKLDLPLINVKSGRKGPKLFITAGMHGDEVTSIYIAKTLLERLDGKLLNGEVYALPMLNPLGFKNKSRYVENKQDLNRYFPGKKKGNLAERIAFEAMSKIREVKPDLLIDLHNDWINSVFYGLMDVKPEGANEKVYKKTEEFGKILGIPFMLDPEVMKGAISHSALLNGIPALTLELGEAYVINKNNIREGVKILLNILMDMGMIKKGKRFNWNPKVIRERTLTYSNKPLPKISGRIKFLVKPGQIIKKGKEIAHIMGSKKAVERLFAGNDAIVLGLSDFKDAKPRREIIALGVIRYVTKDK